MGAHVFADLCPHVEERALTFVVTGAVLVGRAEVTDDDRTVNGGDDLTERHL